MRACPRRLLALLFAPQRRGLIGADRALSFRQLHARAPHLLKSLAQTKCEGCRRNGELLVGPQTRRFFAIRASSIKRGFFVDQWWSWQMLRS